MLKLKMQVIGCCIATGIALLSAPASAALLSYWDFEGNFNDTVGSNHATTIVYSGTFTGIGANDAATAAVAGRSGQSLVLDGNGDGLQTPADASLDFGDGASFTISFWYKAVPNTLDNNNTTAVGDGRSTFIMRDAGANPFNGYSVLADTINAGETGAAATSQSFRTSLDGGEAADGFLLDNALDVTNTYFNDNWHHVAVVVSDIGAVTGSAKFYFDGNVIASETDLSRLLADTDGGLSSGAVPLYMGAERTNGNRWLQGAMDDVAIWGNALPESSIVGLSNNIYTPITAPLTQGPHAGDFDGDGDVDGADFVAWQTNFPKATGATLAEGDADGDGDVDGADFVVWQTNFPFTPGPGASPVPEPDGIWLVALGCLLTAIYWTREHRRRFVVPAARTARRDETRRICMEPM